jgi:NADH dehydrogenase FAD-containing subunit
MGKHLVFVGGGHAHMTCLKNLRSFITKGHRITLVSPSPYHYYSGMGPGMLAGTYRPQEIRFHVRKTVQTVGGDFLEDRVIRVDPKRRVLFLNSGAEVSYDVVSLNTGSAVPLDQIETKAANNVFTVKPIVNLLKARQAILNLIQGGRSRILVVGGGPAGFEITGNAWQLVRENRGNGRFTLLAGRKLLAGFPEKVRRLAMRSFSARGIEVVEGSRLSKLETNLARLDDGREYPFDIAFLALGVRPSGPFQESGLPTGRDGGLLVNANLQSPAHPEIFGGGDCISFQDRPLNKVGVYAVRQNPILYHNLMAALEGRELRSFVPQDVYLLILNLGDRRGIFWRRNVMFDGRLAFRIKDHIDRKFMRTFQVSGEPAEL